MKLGLLSIIVLLSIQGYSQPFLIGKKWVKSSGPKEDSVAWNMSLLPFEQTGSRNLDGNTKDSVFSDTAPNGWRIETGPTANWAAYTDGKTAIDNLININGYFADLPTTIFKSAHFNYNGGNYATGFYHYKITGLNPAYQVNIRISGARGSTLGFDANPMSYVVEGATTPSAITVDGNTVSANSHTQTTGASFTLYPNSSGEIYIYGNRVIGSSILCLISVIKVKSIIP